MDIAQGHRPHEVEARWVELPPQLTEGDRPPVTGGDQDLIVAYEHRQTSKEEDPTDREEEDPTDHPPDGHRRDLPIVAYRSARPRPTLRARLPPEFNPRRRPLFQESL